MNHPPASARVTIKVIGNDGVGAATLFVIAAKAAIQDGPLPGSRTSLIQREHNRIPTLPARSPSISLRTNGRKRPLVTPSLCQPRGFPDCGLRRNDGGGLSPLTPALSHQGRGGEFILPPLREGIKGRVIRPRGRSTPSRPSTSPFLLTRFLGLFTFEASIPPPKPRRRSYGHGPANPDIPLSHHGNHP